MIVVDASAVVNALVGGEASDELIALLADQDLHAPALLGFEVASALRGHVLGGRLTPAEVEAALLDHGSMRIERHQMTALLPAVLDLRENFTVYDGAYVLLAQVLDCALVTADMKLGEARRLGVDVRMV